MVTAGLTEILDPVTLPMPLSIDKDVAPDTDQLSEVLCPAVMPLGAALKPEMTGGNGVTVTVAVLVTEPPPLVAVKVYVVVTAGLTETLEPVTVPTPLSIDIELAPETDQDSVDDCPAIIPAGLAVKLEMTGGNGVTVTVVELFTEPPALLAVKV